MYWEKVPFNNLTAFEIYLMTGICQENVPVNLLLANFEQFLRNKCE